MNIKGMDKNMQCRGFQFEIGKEYKIDRDGRPLKLCSSTVFHYCKSLSQVHGYYDCNKENNRYFEIEVLGEEVTDGEKCGSNHIKIIREITGEELKLMKGLNGTNTGLFNSGYETAATGTAATGIAATETAATGTAATGTAATETAATGTAATETAATETAATGIAATETAATGTAATETAVLRTNVTIQTVRSAMNPITTSESSTSRQG